MTYGSNATGRATLCKRCGGIDVDDTDTGPSTHQQQCRRTREWNVWRKGLIIGAFGLAFVVLTVLLVRMVQRDRADLTAYCKPRGYIGAGIELRGPYYCIDANGNEVAIKEPDWRRAVR